MITKAKKMETVKFPEIDPVEITSEARIDAQSLLPYSIVNRLLNSSAFETHYRLTDEFRYTTSTDYIYHGPDNAVTGVPDPIKVIITLANFRAVTFYFEANMTGQDSAYCMARLYDVTNSVAVTGSEITSTIGSVASRKRSGALTITAPISEYAVQYKRYGGDGSDFPGLFEAHLIAQVTL